MEQDPTFGLDPERLARLLAIAAGRTEMPADDKAATLSLPDAGGVTLTRQDAEGEPSVEAVLRAAGPAAGRYVEQGRIAQGGMGEVVLCVDRDIRRPVAMKRMLPATAADPARCARFVEEAQVTGQLEHPNIVPVYELTRQPDGSVYYTMKLVKGKSLEQIIRDLRDHKDHRDDSGHASRVTGHESPPSLGELLQIFLKVCDGVAFAHSRGVVHRDLKPANIMVGDYGEVLVMDWGLAKIVRRGDVGGPSPAREERGAETPRLQQESDHASRVTRQDSTPQIVSDRHEMSALQTMAGSMLGTPAYMSPEQAKGELDHIDARSDIWSLGAILYEILTLERAFAGETTYAILAAILRCPIVPPEQRAPGRNVPRELSAIAMKCLHRGRAHRYRSVLDLKRDLTLYLEGRSVSAAPDTFSQAFVKLVKRNRGVSASVAAAAVIVVALATFSYVRIARALGRAVASEGRAVTNEKAAVAARDARRATALAASERFARQAALAAENYRWAEADERLGDAQAVCPDGPWTPYARGRLAQIKGDHEGAIKLFDSALKIALGQREIAAARDKSQSLLQRIAEARKALKEGGQLANWQVAEKLGDTFSEIENWREASKAYEQALQLLPPNVARGDLEDKLASARAWIACEGFDKTIRDLPWEDQLKRVLDKLAEVHGVAIPRGQVAEEGGRVSFLQFAHVPLRHIQPLRGLPLRKLQTGVLQGPGVTDLRPLRGMPLRDLDLSGSKVKDLSPLKGMALDRLGIVRTLVTDLSPLQGMPLTYLCCNGAVSRLDALRGMPLTYLELGDYSQVGDITPLRGMPLKGLDVRGSRVTDLSPLEGMPMEFLYATGCNGLRNIAPLKGMPLKGLWLSNTAVDDLSALAGMPLSDLRFQETKVTDLTPLDGMAIQVIEFGPRSIKKGLHVLRNMKTLTQIHAGGGVSAAPEDFWKRYDAGEFK